MNNVFTIGSLTFGTYLIYKYIKLKKPYNLFFGIFFFIDFITTIFPDNYLSSEITTIINIVAGLLFLLGILFSIKPILKQIKLESEG